MALEKYQKYMVPKADKSNFINVDFNEPIPEISLNDNITENVTEE